jgi:segregation and condensation protein B
VRWAFFRRGPRAAADRSGVVRGEKLARLEAALFCADGALSIRKLVQAATLADAAETRALLDALNAAYDVGGSAFRVERVASGYQLLTRPAYAKWLGRLHQRQSDLKLSAPALETLTIIAYRQPITRADVEAVRGVQSAEMIKQLMERGLVKICGEDDSLGRPYLYDTTRRFLEVFGLKSLGDLPMADRLRRTTPSEDAEAPELLTTEVTGNEH